MKKHLLISFIASLILCACGSDDIDTVCYSFDIRSCQADPWAGDSSDSSTETIKSYLSTRGVETEKITIDKNFHEVVCLACDVCPAGPRVFLEIDNEDQASLKAIGLLSLELDDCK